MRGNKRRKVTVSFPNETTMEFESVTLCAKTLGLTNDCINRALKHGYIMSVPALKIYDTEPK